MPSLTTALRRLHRDERGIALALAIFALVIIATLVAGVFFMARLEQRGGSNALWSTQAAEAADAGLNTTLANWNTGYNSMAVGSSQTLATATMPGNLARYTASVMKVSDQIFLISSRGERTAAGGGGVLAGTSVGRIVRIVTPDININAAVTANGPVTLQGNLTVDGRDSAPTNWPACATNDTVAGVRSSQSIKAQGNPHLFGNPPLAPNDGDKYDQIKGAYDLFSSLPNKAHLGNWSASDSPRPSTHVVNGTTVCNPGDIRNWGEMWRNPPPPAGATPGIVSLCTSYSPIIWIKNSGGTAKITGGRGQGVILVDGDLEMAGGFEFAGVMIVLGDVRTTGQGAKITGALLALNEATSDITYIGGTPMVRYSSCAIAAALGSASSVRPLAERSWVQLY